MSLKNELFLLQASNGDLGRRIAEFKDSHSDPRERQKLGSLALAELLSMTDFQIINDPNPDIYKLVADHETLIEIIKNVGAENIYEGIMSYSEKLRLVPGAIIQNRLSEWAEKLLLQAGLALVSNPYR